MQWYLYRHLRSFHKIKANSEYEASLLLAVRRIYSAFYYKLVGVFNTKSEAKAFINKTRKDGYINDSNTLVNKE